ncbi:MAG: hypothetical protein AAF567_05495 [Actinomycetota bacterium]
MLNISEIAASTEERVLTGVKAGQALVIDGLKNAVSLADRVIPEQVSDRFEAGAERIPAAAPVAEGAFGFAGKLLDAQRDFVGDMIEIFQPSATPSAAKKSTKKAA